MSEVSFFNKQSLVDRAKELLPVNNSEIAATVIQLKKECTGFFSWLFLCLFCCRLKSAVARAFQELHPQEANPNLSGIVVKQAAPQHLVPALEALDIQPDDEDEKRQNAIAFAKELGTDQEVEEIIAYSNNFNLEQAVLEAPSKDSMARKMFHLAEILNEKILDSGSPEGLNNIDTSFVSSLTKQNIIKACQEQGTNFLLIQHAIDFYKARYQKIMQNPQFAQRGVLLQKIIDDDLKDNKTLAENKKQNNERLLYEKQWVTPQFKVDVERFPVPVFHKQEGKLIPLVDVKTRIEFFKNLSGTPEKEEEISKTPYFLLLELDTQRPINYIHQMIAAMMSHDGFEVHVAPLFFLGLHLQDNKTAIAYEKTENPSEISVIYKTTLTIKLNRDPRPPESDVSEVYFKITVSKNDEGKWTVQPQWYPEGEELFKAENVKK